MTILHARTQASDCARTTERWAGCESVVADLVLDAERQRVATLAADKARLADRDIARFAGKTLAAVSEANGVDVEVEQVNRRLEAAGRDDFVPSSRSQMQVMIDPWLIDALFVLVVHGGVRG